MNNWSFIVRGEGTDTLEIDVYDVIGDSWFGGVSARSVRDAIKNSPGAKSIGVRINSGGGDVIEAFAIYNLLVQHKAPVMVDVDGLAASAASVIAMAGDTIRMGGNAWMMIHNPWMMSMGESDDLRKHADFLDKIRTQIASVYEARTGMSQDEVLALMDAETWMTAGEAKEKGFATDVVPLKGKDGATANASRSLSVAFASLRPDEYRNMPEEVRARASDARAVHEALPKVFKGSKAEWDRLVDTYEGMVATGSLARYRHPRVGDDVAGFVPAQPHREPSSPANDSTSPAETGGAANRSTTIMNEEQFRAQHPELYAAVFEKGKAEGNKSGAEAGRDAERKRVLAHLKLAATTGATKVAHDAIASGASTLDEEVHASYMAAALDRREVAARQEDSSAAVAAIAGAAPTGAPAGQAADLGDHIMALAQQEGGIGA
jgi:ATP-dependent protease ClpP protease subunit